MKLIISHPTGNANLRAAALGFNKAGILSKFYTSIASFEGDLLDKLSSVPSLSELKRRKFDSSLQSITRSWPWRETGRLLSTKIGAGFLSRHETGVFSVDAVYQNLDKRVASLLAREQHAGATAVYAYEDGAEYSFRAAKKSGLRCLYDLPIGYWKTARMIMKAEELKWPEWKSTMVGMIDSDAKLGRKDNELKLADRIYVASRYTASTLNNYEGKLAPVEVIPYGFPPATGERNYKILSGNRKLRLLFVGRLEQRKGIANMFEAVGKLSDYVELTVVGIRSTNDCTPLNAALTKHKYIASLPHGDILKLMKEHDVLLFPSLFEGFGLVITEAMSQGTPVITTERTAGPDLINHGENGWLIEAGSTDQIVDCLESLLLNPLTISSNGKAARETAVLRPWEVYGKELATSILTQGIPTKNILSRNEFTI